MSTHTEPANGGKPAAEKPRRLAALTDDLALKILIAVATTVTLGRLGFDATAALVGAALSPVFAEFLEASVERRRLGRRRLLLLSLLLFLLHCFERAVAALRRRQKPSPPTPPVGGTATRRALLLTGAVATVATVAAFSTAEAISGNSLVADRPLTFFPRDEPLPPDLVAPKLTLPPDIVVEAAGPRQVWFTVSAADGRDGLLEPVCAHKSGARFPLGTTEVRCEVVDGAGNRSAGAFTVTVNQLEAGETIRMRFPERIEVEAAGASGAVADFVVMAWAPDREPLAATCSPRAGSLFPIGRRTVTCTAAADGDSVTRRFPVVVADTSAPRLILPADMTWETVAATRVVSYDVSARDRVDGVVTIACTPRSGSPFPLGTTTVSCTATDVRRNRAGGSFLVTVVRSDDMTAPELDLPEGAVAEATSAAGAVVSYDVDADDNRTDDPSISCMPRSGATFPLGPSLVRCTAVDDAGNQATGVFTVTVVDTGEPTLTLPGDQVVEATSARGASVSYAASARDVVDGSLAVQCSTPSGSLFGLVTTEVRCGARDSAGNSVEGVFDVTVRDTTGPAIEAAGTTGEATSRTGAVVNYKVTARDVVDGAAVPTCAPGSGSTFRLDATTVTCKAADTKGNSSEKSFDVIVTDTTPPKVYPSGDVVFEATSPAGAVAFFRAAKAVDLVDGARPATCSPGSGSRFPLEVSTVTCSATDRRANRGEATFLVTVRDTTPPTLAIDDFTVWIDSGTGTTVDFPPAKDIVAGDIVPTCRPRSGSFFSTRRPTPVRCYAADPSGNTSPTITFTVTVAYTPG